LEYRDKELSGGNTLTARGGRRMDGRWIRQGSWTFDATHEKRQKEVVSDTITVPWAVDPAKRRVRHERRIGKRAPNV
jgi:hypothetical protein